MADATEPSRWSMLRSTPLRDLLRGRVSGRFNWDRRLREVGLPAGAEAVVRDVVRRTRLWRVEKAEVAEELISHFQEGIDHGTAPHVLVGRFGEVRAAAKLIRRGKIRNRPWAWHLLRWTRWGVAAVLALYVGVAIYFFCGRPSPDVDYVGKFNDVVRQTPADQRAWPIYRGVLLSLRGSGWEVVTDHDPHGQHWPAMTAWLRSHPGALARVRMAASKPILGFLLGPNGSGNDPLLFPSQTPPSSWYLLQPWSDMGGLRRLTLLLSCDAALAGDQRDADRLDADVVSILNMADQMHGPSLLSDEVAIGFRSQAYDTLGRALVDAPALLSDRQLGVLADRLAVPRVGFDLIDLSGEQKGFADMVQRTYTRGGLGGGHVAWSAIRSGVWWTPPGWEPGPSPGMGFAQTLGSPLLLAIIAPRNDMLAADTQLMVEMNEELHHPLREVIARQQQRWAAACSVSIRQYLAYNPLVLLAPALHRVGPMAEIVLGRRDGLLVGIALERYRRRTGNYPRQLDQLVPELLPEVPADRITGAPVRYRLIDGKPVVYSVGADRVDDGGVRPSSRLWRGERLRGDVADWDLDAEHAPRGDWVLFPPEPMMPEGD